MYSFPNMAVAAKLRAFRRLVRQVEPEVVHSLYLLYELCGLLGRPRNAIPAIGSIRSDRRLEMRRSGPCLGRLSARWPCDQICNSSLAAEMVSFLDDYM